MTEEAFSWEGIDHGREGLLSGEKWLGVLSVLARHQGENLRDADSAVYRELTEAFPETSWIGQPGDRPFFRDYGRAWTITGVLLPNQDTDGVLELTDRGKALAENPDELRAFFRDFIDSHVERSDSDDRYGLGFSPFATIAESLLRDGDEHQDLDDVRARSEALLGVQASGDSNTSRRRFRTYLRLLENAGAVELNHGVVQITDRAYLGEIRSGQEVFVGDLLEGVGATEDEAPDLVEDEREFETRKQVKREGQRKFAEDLAKAYEGRCCVTGTVEAKVLDAVHIVPYCGRKSNSVRNGLLMATDIHRLFDGYLLGITPDYRIEAGPTLVDHRYRDLDGTEITVPADPAQRPNPDYLSRKFEAFRLAIGT